MTGLAPWKRSESQSGVSNMQSAPASRLRWEWDRLCDRILEDACWPAMSALSEILLDAPDTDESLRVRAEVPGMDTDDVDIRLAGDALTPSARSSTRTDRRVDLAATRSVASGRSEERPSCLAPSILTTCRRSMRTAS